MAGGRKAWGAAVVLCLLAVTGCTAEASTPSPAPAPTSASPSETEQERQERLDYAAAEKAYRTFRAEYNRVLRAGGARRPTEVMRANAGGPYLEDFADLIRAYRGVHARNSGKEKIAYVRPSGYTAKAVLLDVCEDGRSITTQIEKRRIKGELRTARLEVRRVTGRWKVWSGTGRKVATCD